MIHKSFPKKNLGFYPTPLVELSRLSAKLGGPLIFMKRDDLTGLAMGGNKTRKLEYILGDALAMGCDTIITGGAEQSNHCRQTAAAAAMLGVECHLVLGGEEPKRPNGNLLLDKIFGCKIHWTGNNRKGEDIPTIFAQLKMIGKHPYVVPYGGSNELGALAFAEAYCELVSQNNGPPFTHIVFASSSGGTQAGLMLGRHLQKDTCDLIGISIDKEDAGETHFGRHIVALANRAAEKIGHKHELTMDDLQLNADYLGDGYGIVSNREIEAIALTAQTEGVLLDPVYTARAMGGLIDLIRTGQIGKDARVLFWHTGGTPALFTYAELLKSM